MSNSVPFEFEGNGVRIIDQNGAAWFIPKDVLAAMGRKGSRTNEVRSSIEQGLGYEHGSNVSIEDTVGRIQKTVIVDGSAITFMGVEMHITIKSYSVGDHVILYTRSTGGHKKIVPCTVVETGLFNHIKIVSHAGEEVIVSVYSSNITKVTEDEYNQAIMENI